MAVYDFNDYKTFVNESLKSSIGDKPTRKGLSEALGCQPSHVSAVLSGDAHFSSEQAERVANFLKLGKEQTEYFLILLQYNRAGTSQLRNVYDSMLRRLREKTSPLRSKLEIEEDLSDPDKARYYSSWLFPAVHVMLSVKELQTPNAIAQRTGLSIPQVEAALEFLVSVGLAEKQVPTRYVQKRPLLHLDRSSIYVGRHHSNWRLKALQSIEQNREEDLHYSGVVSISESDVLRIRRLLSDSLKAAIDIVRESKEQDVACLCIDFFML